MLKNFLSTNGQDDWMPCEVGQLLIPPDGGPAICMSCPSNYTLTLLWNKGNQNPSDPKQWYCAPNCPTGWANLMTPEGGLPNPFTDAGFSIGPWQEACFPPWNSSWLNDIANGTNPSLNVPSELTAKYNMPNDGGYNIYYMTNATETSYISTPAVKNPIAPIIPLPTPIIPLPSPARNWEKLLITIAGAAALLFIVDKI